MSNQLDTKGFLKLSKRWIGIVLGLVFLFLAIRKTDLDKTFSLIKNVSLLPILFIVSLRILALLIRGFRWRTVLEHVKKISPVTVFRISSIGEMGNYLLPARIGELMRIFIISKKENISKSATLASVFVDRFLDLLTVLTLLLLFSIFVSLPKLIKEVSYIALFVFTIMIISCFVLFLTKNRINRLIQAILSSYPALSLRLNEFVHRFTFSLNSLRNSYQIIRAIFISFFLWSIHILSFHLVLVALNLELPWYASVITVATIGLGMTIPSTPGFVGTYEFFCVSILTIFSIDKSLALACAIISHGLQYIVIISVGLLCYFWENIQLNKISLIRTKKMLIKSYNLD
ncbi:MAG: lysylphosphatidylglycerol synthase transmembrane domain-containing protein [bacterium]